MFSGGCRACRAVSNELLLAMPWNCDYLIVGAGFAGCVFAERMASQDGKRCIIVDRRNHIGGNSHDEFNSVGVLVHKYGPHYFRTNSTRIWEYLSQFTDWHHVHYRILAWTGGRFWQFPINLNTIEQMLGRESSEEEMRGLLAQWRANIKSPANSEEAIVSQIGYPLFEQFYKNYTRKQWGCAARDLAPSVCRRIPIRLNRNNGYFDDTYQALPKQGYHRMFKRMVTHPNIRVILGVDYRELLAHACCGHLIYTGPIDEYFGYCYGRLPYRSLRFEHETLECDFYQPAVQVNYPNEHDFTRIVEIKHATGQAIPWTTIVREFPQAHTSANEPFYPVPNEANNALYEKYAHLARSEKRVSFIGRLATYRYYNMDQVVGMALTEWEKARSCCRGESAPAVISVSKGVQFA